MADGTFNFQPRVVYSFRPYSAAVGALGADFNNVTVLAVLDRETAETIGTDTFAKYAQLLPFLPANTSKNADDTQWLKIRLASGEDTVLPVACINPDTITISQMGKVTVVISKVNPGDIPLIKQALISNGFDNLEITS